MIAAADGSGGYRTTGQALHTLEKADDRNEKAVINITIENSAGSGKIKGQALAAYEDADYGGIMPKRFL